MLFAAIYLVTAGAGFWFVSAGLKRSAKPHLGLVYLRASLSLSFGLVAMVLLVRLVFGFWWMHPGLAVLIGFALPAGMMAII